MKILFAGEGGQGVQLAAEVLTYAAFLENKNASLIPNFGVEQRGGVSIVFVKIEGGNYPKFDKADILAVFCDRALERVQRYVGSQTKIILGPAVMTVYDTKRLIKVNDNGLPVIVWNILVLGKIIELTKVVSRTCVIKSLEERLKEKFKEQPELKRINLKALAPI